MPSVQLTIKSHNAYSASVQGVAIDTPLFNTVSIRTIFLNEYQMLIIGIPMDYQYDVVVIESGPVGYVAAIRAGQLGLKR